MKKIPELFLCFLIIAFLGIGIVLLVLPEPILAKVDIEFDTPTAKADIRADYGGCVLGITMFSIYCFRSRLIAIGLLCNGLILLGYALGRVYSLGVDGVPKAIIFYLLAFELICGIAALFLATTASTTDAAKNRALAEADS
ncbi:MAG: DUF4345 domain-containing protein [Planctomycetota bacterium]